jgi:hypothetical protein
VTPNDPSLPASLCGSGGACQGYPAALRGLDARGALPNQHLWSDGGQIFPLRWTERLSTPQTLPTAADVDVEAPHQGRAQILLILRGHMRVVHGGTTIGTGQRHRHVEPVVDNRWNGPPAVATVGGTGLPAGPTRVDRRGPFRERGRLPKARATRGVQLLPQPLVFPPNRSRSRSSRARSASTRSRSTRTRVNSSFSSSMISRGLRLAASLTRLLCQNSCVSTSQTR